MPQIHRIMAAAVQAESAFGTAASNAYGDFARIHGENFVFTPAQDYIAQPVETTSLGYKFEGVPAGKGGTVTMFVPLSGLSTAADSGVAAVPRADLSRLLKACGLTETLGTGTTVTGSSSTTTSIDCTDASGIAVNSFVRINGEAAFVTAKSTNTLTIAPALSGAPAATDVVYSSASYVLGDSDPGTVTIVGKRDGWIYRFLGCKGTAKPRQIAATGDNRRLGFEFSFQVGTWDRGSSDSEPSGTFPALSRPSALIAKSSPFYWNGSARVAADVTFDPGVAVSAYESVAGTEGRAGYYVTDATPTLAFTAYRSNAAAGDALQTDFASGNKRAAFFQCGTSNGAAFAFYAHKAKVSAYPVEGEKNGLVTLPIQCEVLDSESTTVKPWAFGML